MKIDLNNTEHRIANLLGSRATGMLSRYDGDQLSGRVPGLYCNLIPIIYQVRSSYLTLLSIMLQIHWTR